MFRTILQATAAVALISAAGCDVEAREARMPCAPATEIMKQLSSKYDEAPVAFGLQSNGNLLQVYSSNTKGTWTVVTTTPGGLSCVVAAGRNWESLSVLTGEPA